VRLGELWGHSSTPRCEATSAVPCREWSGTVSCSRTALSMSRRCSFSGITVLCRSSRQLQLQNLPWKKAQSHLLKCDQTVTPGTLYPSSLIWCGCLPIQYRQFCRSIILLILMLLYIFVVSLLTQDLPREYSGIFDKIPSICLCCHYSLHIANKVCMARFTQTVTA